MWFACWVILFGEIDSWDNQLMVAFFGWLPCYNTVIATKAAIINSFSQYRWVPNTLMKWLYPSKAYTDRSICTVTATDCIRLPLRSSSLRSSRMSFQDPWRPSCKSSPEISADSSMTRILRAVNGWTQCESQRIPGSGHRSFLSHLAKINLTPFRSADSPLGGYF